MSSYIKFQDKPGVFTDDTALTASVYYVDSDKIGFDRGKWVIRAGWERATSDTFVGLCRGLFAWRNNEAQPIAALGTHLRAYAFFDADLYNITPVVEVGTLTNPFTTTLGSAVVTVTQASHGRGDGSEVRYANATAVGGITIDGIYEITEVLTANTFTITHTAAATSAATGGGTVDYDFFLPIGLEDNLGGGGYGIGGYGLGGYGEGADVNELYPRTWSLDNWGENLIGNPRGLGLYEWAQAYAAPELVTNGSFAVDANWTKGTGWTIGAGVALGTPGFASLLEQQLELEPASYFLLEFDVTGSAGTVTPRLGTTAIGAAISANGRYRRIFPTGSGTLNFSKDASFAGTIDNVSVTQMLEMVTIPNAPTQNSCMIVTAEDMIMVGGTIDEDTGLFDPLLVRWCARRNNQLWTPGFQAGNTAGSYRLARGSRIVKMLQCRGEVLILTDDTPYVCRFNPDPSINYGFTPLDGGFGIAGANAGTIAGGAAWWLGAKGEVNRYAGGACERVPCSVRKYFVDNLARSQQDKIFASSIEATNEVQFLYPDQRDVATAGGNECSRYIKFNWQEPAWDVGTFERSAWCESPGFGFPLATDLDGVLYFQEKGDSADGGALAWFIETGAFTLRDGKLASIMGVIPDFAGLLGGVQLTVKTYLTPAAMVEEFGPYAINAATEKVDVRAQGRMIALRYEGESAPAGGRCGTPQVDVRDTRCGR